MTALVTTRNAAHGSFSGMIGRVATTLSTWNDARVTRKALSKLTDRELDDIGLTRGDIDAIASRD